jgi:hypothetical protein
VVSDYWVDHGECFLLICGLFFFRQFTDHIGFKLVLIEGFPIDKEFVAGFRSRRDPIDSHEIQALPDFLQFSRDLICSIVSRSPTQIRSISENKKRERAAIASAWTADPIGAD